MNRKMTDLAFATKWGFFGARGAASFVSAAAALAAKKPSAARRAVSAVPLNPQPVSQRNSRRVWPHGVRRTLDCRGLKSMSLNSPDYRVRSSKRAQMADDPDQR